MTAPAPAPAAPSMSVDDILAALQGILDAAEGRDLNDDEVERCDALDKQLTAAKRQAERSAEVRSKHAANVAPVRAGAVVTGAQPKRDDTLERAFGAYLRTGQVNQDIVQLRAQGELAGTEGGYLVPDTFRSKLIERMKAFGGVANVAEEFTTGDGNPVNWPTIDDTSNVGEIVAEAGTFAAGADLVFGTASLGAYKYMAGGASATPLRVSVELLQDAAFDVEGLVSRKLGERIGRIQATHLVSGTGISQPQGIVTGLTGTATAATALVYNDLVAYVHAVDPAYRQGAKWVFNDASLKMIRQLKDGNNRPLLQGADQGIGGSQGGESLLGYPVVIDQAFSNYASNQTTNWGVFGDIAEGYVVRRVKDVVVVVNPWTRAANGQVEFTAWARMDAVQQNLNAYIALTGHA